MHFQGRTCELPCDGGPIEPCGGSDKGTCDAETGRCHCKSSRLLSSSACTRCAPPYIGELCHLLCPTNSQSGAVCSGVGHCMIPTTQPETAVCQGCSAGTPRFGTHTRHWQLTLAASTGHCQFPMASGIGSILICRKGDANYSGNGTVENSLKNVAFRCLLARFGVL